MGGIIDLSEHTKGLFKEHPSFWATANWEIVDKDFNLPGDYDEGTIGIRISQNPTFGPIDDAFFPFGPVSDKIKYVKYHNDALEMILDEDVHLLIPNPNYEEGVNESKSTTSFDTNSILLINPHLGDEYSRFHGYKGGVFVQAANSGALVPMFDKNNKHISKLYNAIAAEQIEKQYKDDIFLYENIPENIKVLA